MARRGSTRKTSSIAPEAGKKISGPVGDQRARVRRLRGKAILCIEDVAEFSRLLSEAFPNAVYFFANYKTGIPTPPKFPKGVAITVFNTLDVAVQAAMSFERDRPIYNGPDFNRPDIICRLPWPEQLASGAPELLIGGRGFPDQTCNIASQYRELGQWFRLHFPSKGYQFPRISTDKAINWCLDLKKRRGQAYMPFQILDSVHSEFFSLYDSNDKETAAFAKRTFSLWRRLCTNKVAHYDPNTGQVVRPAEWDGKYPWLVGKHALAGALLTPPRYAGFAPRPATDGQPLMLGPPQKNDKPMPAG